MLTLHYHPKRMETDDRLFLFLNYQAATKLAIVALGSAPVRSVVLQNLNPIPHKIGRFFQHTQGWLVIIEFPSSGEYGYYRCRDIGRFGSQFFLDFQGNSLYLDQLLELP